MLGGWLIGPCAMALGRWWCCASRTATPKTRRRRPPAGTEVRSLLCASAACWPVARVALARVADEVETFVTEGAKAERSEHPSGLEVGGKVPSPGGRREEHTSWLAGWLIPRVGVRA